MEDLKQVKTVTHDNARDMVNFGKMVENKEMVSLPCSSNLLDISIDLLITYNVPLYNFLYP